MISVMILLFVITLVYIAVSDRLVSMVRLLSLQGVLLFVVAILELHKVDALNFGFIIAETLLVKGVVLPYLLFRTIKKNKLERETNLTVSPILSLIIVSGFVFGSFLMGFTLHDHHIKVGYFTASVSALLTGLFIVVARQKIVTHVMGYLVLENGIFLLSLAVGNEMPLAVNTAILLDLLSSVLLLAFLVDAVGKTFKTTDVHELNELTD
ncbi:MAG: hypothetical protein HQ472_06815 [Ignavibacteria bacterium]|nr:hypothetical protein [Ignavibacteria bacterium]